MSASSTTAADMASLFDHLVPGYDRFNRLSSLGLDHRWRETLVRQIPRGTRVLDVGTGTGDTALLAASKGAQVTGVDLSPLMIKAAHRKAGAVPSLRWEVADASRLPYSDRSFDVVTSSFVLRNLHRLGRLTASFEEAARVLETGGRFLALDLTRPLNALMAWGHRVYLGAFLPLIGRAAFGKEWPGTYLKTSIQEFPEPDGILRTLGDAGFGEARYRPLSGGIAGIFSATRT